MRTPDRSLFGSLREQTAYGHGRNIMHPIERALQSQLTGLDRVFVGYSGGLDSTALLLAAIRVFGKDGVTALHVNHQLQIDAEQFEAHCVTVCGELETIIEHARVVVAPGNTEAQSRVARYDYYARCLGAGDVVLLGHHAQDNVETALLRLVQGRGFVTMASRGDVGAGWFLRPLLGFSKDALQVYVSESGISWIEDTSNMDTALDRNYLRHEVIPKLRNRWPSFDTNFARVGKNVDALVEVLRHEMAQKGNTISMAAVPVAATNRIVWLRAFLQCRGHFSVSDKALSEFCRRLADNPAATMIIGDSMLGAYEEELVYEPRTPAPISERMLVTTVDETIDLGWAALILRPADRNDDGALWFPGALQIRSRRGGERIRLENGGSKKVKNLFAEHRVAPWRRDAYPLLFDGEDLVAIPGLASARPNLTPDSENEPNTGPNTGLEDGRGPRVGMWCKAHLRLNG